MKIAYRNTTNAPYVSGDSIAELADYWAFGRNDSEELDIVALKRAKSIFVSGHRLYELLSSYSSEISATTLISGNSDENFTKIPILPPSVQLFLCQNLAQNLDGLAYTLPIGLENLRLGRSGRRHFHQEQTRFEFSQRILVPPMSPTNPIRNRVLPQLKERSEIFSIFTEYLDSHKYFKLTKNYRYILVLEGNGFENHRVWEALYQNSFPVMLRTPWSQNLSKLDLPILYVDSLLEINSKLLMNHLEVHNEFKASNHEALWTPYWNEVIRCSTFRRPKKGY